MTETYKYSFFLYDNDVVDQHICGALGDMTNIFTLKEKPFHITFAFTDRKIPINNDDMTKIANMSEEERTFSNPRFDVFGDNLLVVRFDHHCPTLDEMVNRIRKESGVNTHIVGLQPHITLGPLTHPVDPSKFPKIYPFQVKISGIGYKH